MLRVVKSTLLVVKYDNMGKWTWVNSRHLPYSNEKNFDPLWSKLSTVVLYYRMFLLEGLFSSQNT